MTAGMWRPAHGHCAAVLSCPNRCECGDQVRAELEAERALLDATNEETPATEPTDAPEADSGRLGTIYGLVRAFTTRGN